MSAVVAVLIAVVLGVVAGPPASAQTTALVVANPGNQSTAWSFDVNLQMHASGGTQPYRWSATGLMPGAGIDSSTGLISGAAFGARDGTYTVTVTVVDATGIPASTSFQWRVFAACARC
jgi:hypothetical protein